MSKLKKDDKCNHIVCLDVDYNEGHGDVTDCYVNLGTQDEMNSPGGYNRTDFKFCPMCGIELKEFNYRRADSGWSNVYTKIVGIDYEPVGDEEECEKDQ